MNWEKAAFTITESISAITLAHEELILGKIPKLDIYLTKRYIFLTVKVMTLTLKICYGTGLVDWLKISLELRG